MKTLLNPKWLLLLNTIPVVILLVLLGGEYSMIQSLLPAASKQTWLSLGGVLVGLALVHAAYAVWQLGRGRQLSVRYGLVALGGYIAFLYFYASSLSELFPAVVPQWLLAGEMPLYAGTFLMPTLAHAALVLLIRCTPDDQSHRALPNFGVALSIPLAVFLFAQLILPLWRVPGGKFGGHVLVIVLVAATVAFLFFLARGAYIVISQRTGVWVEYQLAWKISVALVLPLLGLLVNNGVLLSKGLFAATGVFGNFSGPWFYGLAIINGVLLCLPPPAGKWGRLALFAARSFTLAYTLYFFLVFLPFLPLSVVAVVAVGLGFLMLTPLLLLLVHLRELGQDFAALGGFFSRRTLVSVLLVSLAVLPLGITGLYWYQRQVLHQALAYLYTPDYAQSQPIDETFLAPTLRAVRNHKDGWQTGMFGANLPYLSTYFNWLVLDNLTLSDEKLNRLERVFLNKQPPEKRRFARPEPATEALPGPELTTLTSRSTYDAGQQAWTSWVHLELTNASASGNAEYTTTLKLPVGCWVRNYYLDMEGRREYGILAEKKAAKWVYAQIRATRRDPGILYYLTGNTVALRVFPFAAGQVRRTGWQLLHKEPITLQVAGRAVRLGTTRREATPTLTAGGGSVVYLSAAVKRALPLVQRKPYYHFLLDASAANYAVYTQKIQAFLRPRPGAAATARYSLVSATSTPVPAGSDWRPQLAATSSVGGYYLEGAIRQALFEAQTKPQADYPILVAVTTSAANAILPPDFADFLGATPEQATFYMLTADASPVAHAFRQVAMTSPVPAVDAIGGVAVRAWPNASQPRAYLADTEEPAIVLGTADLEMPPTIGTSRSWEAGLWLQGYQHFQTLYPAAAQTTRVDAIRASFRSGIMTPLTSYLALENEAQKAALRRKQAQVLAGNAALDAGEEVQRMSEPEVWLLVVLVGLGQLLRYRKRLRSGLTNTISEYLLTR